MTIYRYASLHTKDFKVSVMKLIFITACRVFMMLFWCKLEAGAVLKKINHNFLKIL